MIFTSYFGNIRRIKQAGIVPVSIARYNPEFFQGKTIIELAPTHKMFGMTWDQFDFHYKNMLARLDARQVVEKIKNYGKGRQVALLCYEK